MNKKQILIIIAGVFITSTYINIYFHFRRNTNTIQSLHNQSSSLQSNNEYLERCLKYRFNINKNKFPLIPDKGIIVYFSGKVCPSCIENLLFYLSKNEETKKRTLILVDRNSKLEFILSFNDAYQQNFSYLYDSTEFIKPINEILVLNVLEQDVKIVLEYRPEEKEIFTKYFNIFFINNN